MEGLSLLIGTFLGAIAVHFCGGLIRSRRERAAAEAANAQFVAIEVSEAARRSPRHKFLQQMFSQSWALMTRAEVMQYLAEQLRLLDRELPAVDLGAAFMQFDKIKVGEAIAGSGQYVLIQRFRQHIGRTQEPAEMVNFLADELRRLEEEQR